MSKIPEIDKARYGFKGTIRCFYDAQVAQSILMFKKEGYYSERNDQTTCHINLEPMMAVGDATEEHERASEGMYDWVDIMYDSIRTMMGLDLGKPKMDPIILLFDLKNYKQNIIYDPGLEYVVKGPIAVKDIQILNRKHVENLKSYLVNASKKEIDLLKRILCTNLKLEFREKPAKVIKLRN